MEKTYPRISYFFIGILICTLVGFYFTYTMKFPTFEGLSGIHHFHGAMLMSWFAMLIVQPFLISYKKYEWHRQLGKQGKAICSNYLSSEVSFLNDDFK